MTRGLYSDQWILHATMITNFASWTFSNKRGFRFCNKALVWYLYSSSWFNLLFLFLCAIKCCVLFLCSIQMLLHKAANSQTNKKTMLGITYVCIEFSYFVQWEIRNTGALQIRPTDPPNVISRETWDQISMWYECFHFQSLGSRLYMMTSSNGNIFRVTDHLCVKFTGHWWISCTTASDAELWCFLWSAPE